MTLQSRARGLWRMTSWTGAVLGGGAGASGAGVAMRWHYLPDYPAYRETVTVHHDRGTLQVAFPSPYLLNARSELLVVGGGVLWQRTTAQTRRRVKKTG